MNALNITLSQAQAAIAQAREWHKMGCPMLAKDLLSKALILIRLAELEVA